MYNTQHLCFEHLLVLSFRALGTRGLELLLGTVLPDEDALGQTTLQCCNGLNLSEILPQKLGFLK